jgi:hypothetical protein
MRLSKVDIKYLLDIKKVQKNYNLGLLIKMK